MKYEKRQIVCLPNAVASASANPLLKEIPVADGPHGSHTTSEPTHPMSSPHPLLVCLKAWFCNLNR
jgi:hypothetical protein